MKLRQGCWSVGWMRRADLSQLGEEGSGEEGWGHSGGEVSWSLWGQRSCRLLSGEPAPDPVGGGACLGGTGGENRRPRESAPDCCLLSEHG